MPATGGAPYRHDFVGGSGSPGPCNSLGREEITRSRSRVKRSSWSRFLLPAPHGQPPIVGTVLPTIDSRAVVAGQAAGQDQPARRRPDDGQRWPGRTDGGARGGGGGGPA